MGRSKGEGTISKLPDGRWRARIRYGGRDFYGERVRTKREAVATLPEVRERAYGPQDTDEPTVAEYVREYLDGRREELAQNSWRLYDRMERLYIGPNLDMPVSALRTPDLQKLYKRLKDDGVGTATIGRVHSVLSVALGEAVRMGLIDHSPATHAKPPRHTSKDPHPLTPDEAKALLRACRAPAAPSGRIIAAILLLGLRLNEAIELRWHHIDRAEGFLTVPGTKTQSSAARLPLPRVALEVIGEQGDAAVTDPVFPSTVDASRRTSRQTVSRHLLALLDALGIERRRIHDLRHSTGSLLAASGVPTRLIQSVLRHTSAAMSVHYSRSYDPDLREALDQLGDALVT
ncbi:tyrosine-type recombinase/integrase [Euzebya sp.]|uniref:tyrosine-type recombinase/integrase n=1 Tax=Euzebya sp. TaxID=1971409 RepID=UPI003512BCF9